MKEKAKSERSSSLKADLDRLKKLAMSESGFLFDPVTGYTYNLNATAIHLLHELQEGKTRADLLKDIEKQYLANANDLERDLDQFLGLLEEYGLLIWKNNEK